MKKSYFIRFIFPVFFLGVFPFYNYSQKTIPQENMLSAAQYAEETGGVAMVVLQNDSVVFESYHNGADSTVVTHIHSGTKAFWALLAAAAKESGLISSYEELVSETIIEWKDKTKHPNKEFIRIKHLLSLSSGLSQSIFNVQNDESEIDDLYQYAVDSLSLNFIPGNRFQYGPSDYYVFGELIKRKLSAKGIEQTPLEFLDSLIFKPIGLEYDSWTHDSTGNPRIPNGCTIAPREWIKFGKLLLQNGRWEEEQLVKASLVEELFLAEGPNLGHGKFVWLNNVDGQGAFSFQAAPSGSAGGFIYYDGYPDIIGALGAGKNRLYIIPSLNAVVVRQTLSDQDEFDDHLFLSLLLNNSTSTTYHPKIKQSDLRVYPNPFKDKVFIESDLEGSDIRIYNGVGKLIVEYLNVDSSRLIDLSEQENGFYFLSVINENNGHSELVKIIKSK